ncbi:MAG TPA: hypothetical protein VNZ64_02145 [Candidatus Acidoferrum sp.]|jgi:hypothetical protein|nr:hypothetical protein [Candidatus Acidoferrum sp.]
MCVFSLICYTAVDLLKQAWLLPRSVAVALRQRRRRFALNILEAERLDRIRNPSKYLGK